MTQRTISIRTIDSVRQISAWCIGHMAVHRQELRDAAPSEDSWQVTHAPSGICFRPIFPSRTAAIAAALDINKLRPDWATFDPATVTAEFKASLREIYRRYEGIAFPPVDGDRRQKLARQEYAPDLNGYGAKR